MTLKEVLQPYLPEQTDTLFDIIKKTTSFTRYLQKLDQENPVVSKILDLIQFISNERYPSPISFLRYIEALGISEDVDFDKFWQFFSLMNELNFSCPCSTITTSLYKQFKDNLKEIKAGDLTDYLRTIPIVGSSVGIRIADSKYYVPKSIDVVENILSLYKDDSLPYISERRDCDDFSVMFKAFLARGGLGNLSAGIYWGKFTTNTGRVIYHSVVLMVYYEGEELSWKLYEPQRENLFYKIGEKGDFKEVEPMFVYF